MSNPLHVHIPFRQLEENLSFLLENRLQPEVAFKGPDLDLLDYSALAAFGKRLGNAGLAVTLHAPFMDLNPGSIEPLVHQATAHRYRQALVAAECLGGRVTVFHPGYDVWRYGEQRQQWVEQNLLFWPPLIEQARKIGCRMALENIFEPDTGTLSEVLSLLDSPYLGHCFDVGHWRLFAKISMAEWFSSMGDHIVHLHLHDNFGEHDDHLPVGEGTIPFDELFGLIRTLGAETSMTLEAHSRPALLRSLAAIPFYFPSAGRSQK